MHRPFEALMPRKLLGSLSIFLIVTNLHAQGFVEHFEPPVLERGKTTRVTVVGAGLGKATGLWTCAPTGSVHAVPVGPAAPTRAVLDVTVSAEVPIGILGVRLATEDGLANACLMLIDDLPVRPAPTATEKIALPIALWGRFREAEIDRFDIDVSTGQSVSFDAVANRLGKDVDPLVTIRDAAGRMIAEHDNDPGLGFDCRFEHTFTKAGTYRVEMRDARFHGSEHGMYVLRMGKFLAARVGHPPVIRTGADAELVFFGTHGLGANVKAPSAPGLFAAEVRRRRDEGSAWVTLLATDGPVTTHSESYGLPTEGQPVPIPGVVCGVLKGPSEWHTYRLDLAKGQKIRALTHARDLGSEADIELAIVDAKGKEIRRASENPKEEIALDFTANTAGIYGLRVRDGFRDGGPAFSYAVEIGPAQPRVQIAAEVEGLTVPRGGYWTLPLKLQRTDAPVPVSLTLLGAPAGVTLTPTEIAAGADACICRLEAAADAPLGLHTLQIVARQKSDAAPLFVRTQPLIDRQLFNVDLIPYGLREDQRWLPPALTERFALQVTPPAPFAVELPETLVTLGRYQSVDFPIVTTRVPGFDGPISFAVKGGQLGPKEEGRTRVYAELPDATRQRPTSTGTIRSLILTNTAKHRVDLTATGIHEGRRVTLTRAFDLDVRSAFELSAEPATLKLEPGESGNVRIAVQRLKGFDGDVVVHLSPGLDVTYPEKLVIPRGKSEAEFTIAVDPNRTPGRQTIQFQATATVEGYEEEQRNLRVEIDITKRPAVKK
jgi:hypothetical protein